MIAAPTKRTAAFVHTVEQAALAESVKAEFAIFRSTQLSFLFDYHHSIQGYRDGVQRYSKSTPRKDLRVALVTLFREKGDSQAEAEATAEVNLMKGLDD